MKFGVILIAAVGSQACDKTLAYRTHQRHLSLHEPHDTLPPILDRNERILVDSFDSISLANSSYFYTHGLHLAGKNKTVAEWTASQWAEYGFESRLDEYHVYLNYPVHQSIQLHYGNGSTYTPTLEEAVLAVDPTTSYPDRTPAFNGYSATGNASAPYVYVGRGHRLDFARLAALGVQLEGKIALAKYGGPFRGVKVENAQKHGMIGVVLFTDPSDDGAVTEANGLAAYPDGPARNPTSLQRGTVMFLGSTYPGDPTTPGYPSKRDSPRQKPGNIPSIPSIPISWLEAKPLLQALNGHGAVLNRTGWVGAIPGVTYHSGPAEGMTISLCNIMEDKTTPIWNVVGVINGSLNDEVVVVGNHRDAWMIGGAADPHAGTAILVELAKAFGNLVRTTSWRPSRTIVLASWDGEEYGLLGSTEWVEEYLPWLKKTAVAYLNTDVAVSGTIPDFSASPDLHGITTYIMKKVMWPYNGTMDRSMYDIWEQKSGEIDILGAQSDYTPFVQRSGIASIDLGTTRDRNVDPIYHYHSNFDSYHWMEAYCDPGFAMHKAVGQYLALYLYHMVNDPFLPLEPTAYATEMRAWLDELSKAVSSASVQGARSLPLDLSPLRNGIKVFSDAADAYYAERTKALKNNDWPVLTALNLRSRDFSREFTNQGGLPGREFYRNVIFAPDQDTGYMGLAFPGVNEMVASGRFEDAEVEMHRCVRALEAAAAVLNGEDEG